MLSGFFLGSVVPHAPVPGLDAGRSWLLRPCRECSIAVFSTRTPLTTDAKDQREQEGG
jgi:hypothetical protein